MSSTSDLLANNKLLYFLHIPKTAGTSFTDFIKSQFAPFESNSSTYIEHLIKTPPEEVAKYKLIAGHFLYNVDDFVKRELVYITMLRDPVQRTISHFAQIRRSPGHRGYDVIKSQSLLEFVRDPQAQLYANLQTRYIGLDTNFFELAASFDNTLYQRFDLQQPADPHSPNGYLDPTLLERAQERMSKFAFVGIAERFDESLELLSATFGWVPPVASKVINFGTNRPHEDEVSQEVIDVIRENNKLDIALYEMGKQMFVERYNQIAHNRGEKVGLSIDLHEDTMAGMQRKIDLLQKANHQLGEELQVIQNSFGWRFILRANALRLKLIPHGSKRETLYLKLRGR
jgi:hypothetical protein